jgi:hypothetical protein
MAMDQELVDVDERIDMLEEVGRRFDAFLDGLRDLIEQTEDLAPGEEGGENPPPTITPMSTEPATETPVPTPTPSQTPTPEPDVTVIPLATPTP